ncbi:hypothetical protein [Burkholderia sp. L27(2015)]|uniref:hypothetical protein n=1 Tax=Burkholderia sp. L27(2015) TaxID=1641858 RepID=UPI00131B760F|nr:hypothetical protein [Burkholderia sp. L27(2015)]
MNSSVVQQRRFFHSLPRPRADESENETFERGLKILAFMMDVGLVLAPEIVEWDVSAVSGRPEQHRVLQRRACFTELDASELGMHSSIFGPIALSLSLSGLRGAGAMPVIYVPQGTDGSALSQLSTFCMRGVHHTKEVLRTLENLKETSDPAKLAEFAALSGAIVAPDLKLALRNQRASGEVVAEYSVSATDVHNVLQYVGFESIPFNQSIGILNAFQNMFYPTDNAHSGDVLGYYRQREWRLIAGDVNFSGRPMGRALSSNEVTRLNQIDSRFWSQKLMIKGVLQQRSALALVYDPLPGWNFFDLVEKIFGPKGRIAEVCAIVGDKIEVTEHD